MRIVVLVVRVAMWLQVQTVGKTSHQTGHCILEVGSSVNTVTDLGIEISVCATRRNFPLKAQSTEGR